MHCTIDNSYKAVLQVVYPSGGDSCQAVYRGETPADSQTVSETAEGDTENNQNTEETGTQDNSITYPLAGDATISCKTAIEAMPESLKESAYIDGANDLVILFKIVLPLIKPTIAVLLLYYGVGHWNSWFNASIYLRDNNV